MFMDLACCVRAVFAFRDDFGYELWWTSLIMNDVHVSLYTHWRGEKFERKIEENTLV